MTFFYNNNFLIISKSEISLERQGNRERENYINNFNGKGRKINANSSGGNGKQMDDC